MTIAAIAIFLLTGSCFTSDWQRYAPPTGLVPDDKNTSSNDTIPKPVLDLILDYATHAYAASRMDERMAYSQINHVERKERVFNELNDISGGYISHESLRCLLKIIDSIANLLKGRIACGSYHDWPSEKKERDLARWQVVIKDIDGFRKSSFHPSEKMIENIAEMTAEVMYRTDLDIIIPFCFSDDHERRERYEHSVEITASGIYRNDYEDRIYKHWLKLPYDKRKTINTKSSHDRLVLNRYHMLLARNLKISKIDVHQEQSHWEDGEPCSMVLDTVDNTNGGSQPLQTEISFTTSSVEQGTFSTTLNESLGWEVSAGANFKIFAGTSTGTKTSTTLGFSVTSAKMVATTESVTRRSPCVAGQGEKVKCTAIYKTKKGEVPYTVTCKVDRHEFKIKGIWKGVISYEGYMKKEILNTDDENSRSSQDHLNSRMLKASFLNPLGDEIKQKLVEEEIDTEKIFQKLTDNDIEELFKKIGQRLKVKELRNSLNAHSHV